MPIPALTKYGLLPPGIYDCSLDEIGAAFTTIPPQAARLELWTTFLRYVESIRKIGLVTAIYVDGGFTSAVNRANDVDIVLELPPPSPAARSMAKHQLFNCGFAKANFRVHLFLQTDWAPGGDDMREYFQLANPKDAMALGYKPGQRKGILRVPL